MIKETNRYRIADSRYSCDNLNTPQHKLTMHTPCCTLELAFIYNETDRKGNFKAIYYDSTRRFKLKVVENGKRKLIDIMGDQLVEMKNLVTQFISGSMDYDDNGNEDKDHSLLVFSAESSPAVNYYYWKNDEVIPLGVESLLEFFDKLLKFAET